MDNEIIIRFFLAALWGGIVGIEREYRTKSAGFRTMIMISIGSCFFTFISDKLGGPNPDRIAANVVTGIGFLGAGVIFHGENRVNGITTAATIWAVSAVGMGIGAGYYFASACASSFVLAILVILPYIERRIDQMHKSVVYTIRYDKGHYSAAEFEALLAINGLKFKSAKREKDGQDCIASWLVQGNARRHTIFVEQVNAEDRIVKLNY